MDDPAPLRKHAEQHGFATEHTFEHFGHVRVGDVYHTARGAEICTQIDRGDLDQHIGGEPNYLLGISLRLLGSDEQPKYYPDGSIEIQRSGCPTRG